jgi:uncharacterized protein
MIMLALLSEDMTALRRRLPAIALLTLVLALAGCAETEGGLGSAAGDAQGSENSDNRDSGDSDDLETDVNGAVSTSEAYWDAFFQSQGGQFVPVNSVSAYDEPEDGDCAGQAFVLNNAFFCPAGNFIAYDVNFVGAQYQSIGDAFVYYLIGHEYAHAVQDSLGIQHRLTIQHELQADCMAGAYLGDSVRAGNLRIEDGDIDELLTSLASVGDQPGIPWFAEGAHGSGEQRTDAFARGYDGRNGGASSLTSCF